MSEMDFGEYGEDAIAEPGLFQRVIVLNLEGYGVGALPDAVEYQSRGANTLKHVATYVGGLEVPMLQWLGIGNMADVRGVDPADPPAASYGKVARSTPGTSLESGLKEMLGSLPAQLVAAGKDVIILGPAAQYCEDHEATVRQEAASTEELAGLLMDALEVNVNGLIVASVASPSAGELGSHGPVNLARTLALIDVELGGVFDLLAGDSLLIITAASSVDPTVRVKAGGTREYLPMLCYTPVVPSGVNLGVRSSLADIAATVAENFELGEIEGGTSFYGPLLS